MAKRYHTPRVPGILKRFACLCVLLGLIFIAFGWESIRRTETREVFTHTGTFERYYTKRFASARSSTTIYCFVVDGETYYVSSIVWRALDRSGAKDLVPGTLLTLEYWPGRPHRHVDTERELVSISDDQHTYMSRSGCLKEYRSNGMIAIILGGVFVLMGMAIPVIFIVTERQLYRPSSHKHRH